MINPLRTVVEIIEIFKGEGFIYEFCIKDKKLYCVSIDRKYEPKQLVIEKTESNMEEPDAPGNTTIYAIAANDGAKGILIDAYNLYSEPDAAGILQEIPVKNLKASKAS